MLLKINRTKFKMMTLKKEERKKRKTKTTTELTGKKKKRGLPQSFKVTPLSCKRG
jgi:hypothetical protein